MKFKKEFLQNLLWDDKFFDEELYDTSRWSKHYSAIFIFEGKNYMALYSRGATETQDESPFEFDDDEIECYEAIQVVKTIKTWEQKK